MFGCTDVALDERQPTLEERAYIWAASTSLSIEPCKMIGSKAVDRWEFNPTGKQIEALRSRCFRAAAVNAKNPALCDLVQPLPADYSSFLSGVHFNPEHCRQKISANKRVSISLNLGQAEQLRASLGYSDRSIAEECKAHFAVQATQLSDVQSRVASSFNSCMESQTQRTAETPTPLTLDTIPDERRAFCKRRAVRLAGLQDHYLGALDTAYPRKRRYWYCTYYCDTTDMVSSCDKINAVLPANEVVDFLATQARHGNLLERLYNQN